MKIITSNLNRFVIDATKSDSSIWIRDIGALATSRFGVREGWVTPKKYLSELEYILNQIKRK